MQAPAHLLRGITALFVFLFTIPAIHTSEIQQSLLYGHLPIAFERNQGQSNQEVEFLSRGRNHGLFLTRNEAVLVLTCSSERAGRAERKLRAGCGDAQTQAVRLRWTDKQASTVIGENVLPGKVNYLVGRDPAKWHSNINTFGRVRYRNACPGIDLVFYGSQGTLEFDFVVQPGANPRDVALTFDGVRSLQISRNGDLVLQLENGELRQRTPIVYQEINGRRSKLAGHYVIRPGNRVGFEVAKYDPHHALVIDPVLSYSTYVGGSGSDFANSIAVDSSGRAYITGSTTSTDFPTKNARQPQIGGMRNAFVTKLWATGGGLIYSTYLGGSDFDLGTGIAVDRFGNAYVVGDTSSLDFPTTSGAFQTSNRGGQDVFITKLSPSGSTLLYSTYLGGGGFDAARGMALDTSHRVYVAGFTDSFAFPLVNAAQGNYGGSTDAFAVRLNASGTGLSYSTYLGGFGREIGSGMAVDGSNNAYIAGTTQSANFPTTSSAFQRLLKGGADAFITKLTSAGGFAYSTLLGGTGGDSGGGIAVDSSHRAYITGQTESADFPTRNAFQRNSKGVDAYVTRLNASGTGLSYSTYLGGQFGFEAGQSIAVNSSNQAYVTGFTNSADFPVKNALQPQLAGEEDIFVTKLWATGAGLHYSTYLGGRHQEEQFPAVRLDSSGNAYVTGTTFSDDFPTTPGAFRRSFTGTPQFSSDAFVLKIKP